ncbi:MAG: LacI family DNA-binding transcriptional regulator [Lachnospiraceae bacterium]|nr:LacI family DNA-binding transcriptional regulator [Lachnospiraceae bacterium]
MKVSVKKISEITGFSPATVSNAINYKRGVNADTAAKILKTAQDLGYFEENRITKVKFVMFKRNGVVVEDTPFFPLLTTGVEHECRACGMEMIMCNLDKRDSNYEEQARWLLNDKASAVILQGTELMDEDIDLIRGMTSPYVILDYWKEDMSFDAVLINNADSARMATEYLIGKGHQQIGYLRGSFRIKPFRSRAVGYQTALQKAKLPQTNDYVITLSTTMDGAYADMKRYLAARPKLPTAFFADNDMIALGAMKAMSECGIRVPEDISVVGFDDLSFSSISNPPLTTLRVPKQEMGRIAVRRLRDIIKDNDGLKLKTQVCTQFIERDSVRAI